MRPLRYSINVTLDGCCDHRAIPADEELHRHAAENIAQADALLLGRVTYEMMEAAWRPPARTGVRPDWMADWMEPFAPDDRRGEEVRRVEHPGPGRLERGARARRPGKGRRAAQAGAGEGAVRRRRQAPACAGGAGIDRRVRVRGAAQGGGPRADVVRGAVEACRPEARGSAGVRLGGGGDAVRAEKVTLGLRRGRRPL